MMMMMMMMNDDDGTVSFVNGNLLERKSRGGIVILWCSRPRFSLKIKILIEGER